MNLRTTAGVGGPISIFYQFIIGDGNNFTFVWHNTTGPLKEGVGSDPGLPSAAVGAKLFAIMDSLPQTDVELGSILSLGVGTNGVRDPILYHQHIRPQVYIPIHQTDATPISSSLRYKKAYLQALVAARTHPSVRRAGGWSILMILYGRWFTTRRMIAGRKRNPTISGKSTNSVSIISRRFLAEGGGPNRRRPVSMARIKNRS